MNSLKVVVDTNVMVSALLWCGPSHRLIKLAEDNQILLFVTFEILEELEEVIKRDKFRERIRLLSTSVEQLMFLVKGLVRVVEPNEIISCIEVDSDDNIFLSCAIESEAEYIISGDRHLLDLKYFKNIPIVSTNEFLEKKFKGGSK